MAIAIAMSLGPSQPARMQRMGDVTYDTSCVVNKLGVTAEDFGDPLTRYTYMINRRQSGETENKFDSD